MSAAIGRLVHDLCRQIDERDAIIKAQREKIPGVRSVPIESEITRLTDALQRIACASTDGPPAEQMPTIRWLAEGALQGKVL